MRLIEPVEPRLLLAGNVTAQVINGHLFIRGDDEANSILITQTLEGDYLIQSEDTSINGKFSPVEHSANKSVRVNLGRGNDELRVQNATFRRELRITGGGDDDIIRLTGVEVRDDLRITTARGFDMISLLDVTVQDQTRITTSFGADIITADESTFEDDFRLDTGAGRDTIFLGDSVFEDKKQIRSGPGADLITDDRIEKSFDFRQGAQGWTGGFADFFTGREIDHMLESGIRQLPDEIGDGTGFFLSGKNITDDLFMYLTRELGGADGIQPSTIYQVSFDITFASDAPSGCSGIGGAPGESVFLKAGASRRAPSTFTVDDLERLNLDISSQGQSGQNASVVGDIANGQPCENLPAPYRSLTRHHTHTFLIKTDASGTVHLIVGTDSGFEGTTSLYYQKIDVRLLPVADAAPGAIAPETTPDYSGGDENPV